MQPSSPSASGTIGVPVSAGRRTWIAIALTVVMVLAGTWLRWQHLGADFHHFDEVFPSALVARARATGNLDMNVRDADVPEIARHNLYTSSSYHYAVLAWDTVMRVFPGWPNDDPVRPSMLRLRAFSALLETLTLLLFAFGATRMLGAGGGCIATALAAFNPTLIQDAHYARPEGFLTLLTLGFLFVVAREGAPTRRRAIVAGVLFGLLCACKNTMGILCVVPLIWLRGASNKSDVWKLGGWLAAAAIATFLLAAPGFWMHFGDYWDGIQRAKTQYSNPFPVHGPPDGSAHYGMVLAYFTATLGISTAILVAAGGVAWWRGDERRRVWIWLLPPLLFAGYFGSKSIFFERAYSPVLLPLFLVAGAGGAALLRRGIHASVGAALLTGLAILPAACVSLEFVGAAVSGRAMERVRSYEARLREAVPDVTIVETPMWSPIHLDAIREQRATSKGPLIVRVLEYDDAWTPSVYTDFLLRLSAHEFAGLRGPFAGFPVSTLQMYHVPTSRYVWVGSPPPSTLPQPPHEPRGILLGAVISTLGRPAVYYGAAIATGLCCVGLALWAVVRTGPGPHAWVFPLAMLATLLTWRWPSFLHHPELNVDEAHTVAAAMKLAVDPVYWKSVDGTTHGPLNDFVLLLPKLVGMDVGFSSARCVGVLLIAGALIAMWAGLRLLWDEALARVAVLPALAFFALSTFWDFVHYTSEHLPIFLLSSAWALLMVARRSQSRVAWFVGGLALGAVPFAKLQGIPLAAALALLGYGLAWWRNPAEGRVRLRAVLLFSAGLVAPALGILLHLWAYNLWHHFWQSYVLNNLRYATATKMYSLIEMAAQLPKWLRDAEGSAAFVYGLAGFVLAAAAFSFRGSAATRRRIGVAALLGVVGVYVAFAPGRVFHHYLLFAVLPLTGLAAAILAGVATGSPARRAVWCTLFALAGLLPQVVARSQRTHPHLASLRDHPPVLSGVAQRVLQLARAGEPLGIWGFMPRFYVETGLPHASREAHNERQLLPHPQLAYYRGRYLFDLRRQRPPVFLDAVGPGVFWPHDRAVYGHETWPELRDWVAENYRQVDDREGVRIFVRRDRWPDP